MGIGASIKYLFEPELKKEMDEVAKYMTAKEDDMIMDYGQIVRGVPIITSGSVRVYRIDEDGKEILLYYINPQETCAMTFTCCMEQRPSEVRAIADEDVEMIFVPVQYMDSWMMKYVTWKNFVMGTIHDRFNELLKTIDMIAFQKLDERLKHYLQQKSKHIDSKLLNLSHEDIATDLATSRVVISRLLKRLENDGVLLLYRNQIKLLSAFFVEE